MGGGARVASRLVSWLAGASRRGAAGGTRQRLILWYFTGGVPTLSRQIRVWVCCVAQSDEAPAMSGFAVGAKRFVD